MCKHGKSLIRVKIFLFENDLKGPNISTLVLGSRTPYTKKLSIYTVSVGLERAKRKAWEPQGNSM